MSVYTEKDALTGLELTRVTTGVGHCQNLYFTTPSWSPDFSHVYVRGYADQGEGLYRYNCRTGDSRLLTPSGVEVLSASRHPHNDQLAIWIESQLGILDGESGAFTPLWELPAGYKPHSCDFTADGKWMVTGVSRDFSSSLVKRAGINTDAERAHIGKDHDSQVMAIATDGSGRSKILHQSAHLITHINASPTQPDIISFCHEGPWLEIDQRIWGIRISSGEVWPILPKDPQWGVGHEYWCADGETIGYHARFHEGTWRHAAGFVRFDNSEHWQAELSVPTHHAHGVDQQYMVLDGTRESGNYLMIAERSGDEWLAPRVLCRHDTSRHGHASHVHARMRADGKQICFTSNRRGYGDVYLIDVPDDISSLPEWPGKPYRYYWE